MNQTQALARLRKIMGPKVAYRVDPKAPDAEQRAVMRSAWQAARDVAEAAVAARKARYEELLAGEAYTAWIPLVDHWCKVEQPLRGLQIGQRLQRLTQATEEAAA